MEVTERRRALRLHVEIPTEVEGLPNVELALPDALRLVYERVTPAEECRGQKERFVVRDVSTNGAFLEGRPWPLLSRVKFVLPYGAGRFEAVGWVMWRRLRSCMIDSERGPLELSAGMGVLFEAFPIEVRNEIARRAREPSA